MSEFRNDSNLTTADLVNPGRTAVAQQEQPVAPSMREQMHPNEFNRTEGTNTMPDIPAEAPKSAIENANAPVAGTAKAATSGPLFPEDELHNFRARWDGVQTSFVDEPRKAVEDADSLVANVVKRIAEQFANEREQLEKQWDRGDNVNTEDLRQAFKRYRAFFDRLLSF